ncbi:hypothetical protein PG993_006490 [Apiospora rasikravindrae]|uniref:BTB domain-containing protein n=1 Tax=Apiospora rasikravindrae TaxID=990691 RepID=A0ABR1T5V7_9PEZI
MEGLPYRGLCPTPDHSPGRLSGPLPDGLPARTPDRMPNSLPASAPEWSEHRTPVRAPDCQPSHRSPEAIQPHLALPPTTYIGFQDLFLNYKWSDFSVLSQGRAFPLHKSIICSRAKWFEICCRCPHNGLIHNKVNLDTMDVGTLERFFGYLYTGMYDDGLQLECDPTYPPTLSELMGPCDRLSRIPGVSIWADNTQDLRAYQGLLKR